MSLTRVEVTSGTYRAGFLLQYVRSIPHTQVEEDFTNLARPAEVFWTCSNHALSTEAEEIMGLLLGDVTVSWYKLRHTLSADVSDQVPVRHTTRFAGEARG